MPMHMPIDMLGVVMCQQFFLYKLQIVTVYPAVSFLLSEYGSLLPLFARHKIKLESR